MSFCKVDYGVGMGYRPYYAENFENKEVQSPKGNETFSALNCLPIHWLEIISENYMGWIQPENACAAPIKEIIKLREFFPIFMHGVSLSIGSVEKLDFSYLKRLKNLIQIIEPKYVSDHLSWSRTDQVHMQNLLPLPYTRESLNLLCERVDQVQSYLNQPIILENPSAYLKFKGNDWNEWDFFNELMVKTGCGMLLDINNVYVSSKNLNFDPQEYLSKINHQNIFQIHLAGHQVLHGNLLFDTHDQPISEGVWTLFEWYIQSYPSPNVMLEWDDSFPPWEVIVEEISKISRIKAKGSYCYATQESCRDAEITC